tara:strand:- start:445 stop:645 length:201 start_codon:yes stop_codon:yes gene_type:complete
MTKKASKSSYYAYGGPYPQKVKATGGSTSKKMPSYSMGGSASLLTKLTRAPKVKKNMRGCGCGGQV